MAIGRDISSQLKEIFEHLNVVNSVSVSEDDEKTVKEILTKNAPAAGQKKILKSNRR